VVLAASLVMPWIWRAGARAVPVDVGEPVATAAAAMPLIELPAASTAWIESSAPWPSLVPWILAAGVVARLLWVAAGIARLRALRQSGVPVADAEGQEIQRLLGTSAELRSVRGLDQPVTFGVRRPVVLLPESFASSSEPIRRAALTHELVHVQRRDWLWVMAEEALRALFWFHPAIWWLTARVRRGREEFTDHVSVLATGSRRAYIDALLAFADAPQLEPAPAFARRTHLFHRIVLLSKEAAMSSRRIVVSGAALVALLVTGSWYASEAFPVTKASAAALAAAVPAAPQQPDEVPEQVNPITPENPMPRRVFAAPARYPLELSGTTFRGAVEMRVVLNAGGSVASVTRGAVAVTTPDSVTNADRQWATDAFVAAATDAIRQWQYDPPFRAPLAFHVAVTFRPGEDGVASQSEGPRGVSARQSASTSTGTGEASRAFAARVAAGGRAPVRVGGGVAEPRQLRKVPPRYPAVAQSARVSGVVILEVAIDERGGVFDAHVLRSIPLLDQAAIDAVRQWAYTPTLLNGVPVPVIMTVTIVFSLN
jgi:TonB family protein